MKLLKKTEIELISGGLDVFEKDGMLYLWARDAYGIPETQFAPFELVDHFHWTPEAGERVEQYYISIYGESLLP